MTKKQLFKKREFNIQSNVGLNNKNEKKLTRKNFKKNFYVYKYINKSNRIPFYIGKGKNYRKTEHLNQAKSTDIRNPKLDMIRKLGFENGVEIEIIENYLEESKALALESVIIKKIGRKDLGEGPLLNKTNGGEGLSGGVDKYGYKRKGITHFVTDMVHNGEYIQNMPKLFHQFLIDNKMTPKMKEIRILLHILEMGNVGCHYKGPKILLHGWQFSLDRKMIDVNLLSLDTKGFLKVHGDLPFNQGYVAEAPVDYNFGY